MTEPEKYAVTVTRIFDAPRERVWHAWTDPEHFKRWWGPRNYTSPVSQMDLRVGGKYVSSMRAPNGQDFYNAGFYREIVPLERLVYSDSFADPDGNIVPASHYGMPADFPEDLVVILTFEDLDGKTKMTMRHEGLPPGPMTDATAAGWNESFDKLAETLT